MKAFQSTDSDLIGHMDLHLLLIVVIVKILNGRIHFMDLVFAKCFKSTFPHRNPEKRKNGRVIH